MRTPEEYVVRKAAKAAAGHVARREEELKKKWFFRHPDKIVKYTGWLQLYTLALFVATLALFVASVVTAVILHETDVKVGLQVTALTKQLQFLESDQRPWIKVDAQKFGHPLDLTKKGLGIIPVVIVLKNVGKTPAFNVEVQLRTFVYGDGNTDLFGQQHSWCEAHKKNRIGDKAGMIVSNQGTFIFPNEEVRWERFGGIMGTGPIPDDLEKFAQKSGDKRSVDLWLYGCATYDFGRPDTIHQTGFVYRLARLFKQEGLPDSMSYGIELDEAIPSDRLMLFPSPSADGVTN